MNDLLRGTNDIHLPDPKAALLARVADLERQINALVADLQLATEENKHLSELATTRHQERDTARHRARVSRASLHQCRKAHERTALRLQAYIERDAWMVSQPERSLAELTAVDTFHRAVITRAHQLLDQRVTGVNTYAKAIILALSAEIDRWRKGAL